MATRETVLLVDDIDGRKATQTIPFALDGVSYEIDLTDDNAANLRAELADYIKHGRRTNSRDRKSTAAGASSAPSSTEAREKAQAIRDWASTAGYTVAPRGRLAKEIVAAYEAAQLAAQTPASTTRTPRPSRRKAR